MSQQKERLISSDDITTRGNHKGQSVRSMPGHMIEMAELDSQDEPNPDFERRDVKRGETVFYKNRPMIKIGKDQILDTSKMTVNIKKIFKALVMRTIEGERNESDLTKSVADTDRFIFPNGQDMENIYMNVRDTTKFRTAVSFLTAINFFSIIFIMLLVLYTASPRNNAFCFNNHSNTFEACDISSTCSSKEFTDFSSIFVLNSYKGEKLGFYDEFKSLAKVNDIFREAFFVRNLLYQSINNENKLFTKNTMETNSMIYIKYKDVPNLWLEMRNFCNSSDLQIQIAIFCLYGFMLGNFFVTFFADIFGRKKILIFTLLLQIFACFFLIRSLHNILKYDPEFISNSLSDGKNFTDSLQNQFENFTFIKPDYFYYYNDEFAYENFKEKIGFLEFETMVSRKISEKFNENKVVIYMSIMAYCICVSAIFNINLSLTFEFCVRESDIFLYYFKFFFGVMSSYPFGYLLLYLSGSLVGALVVINLGNILLFLGAICFIKESPRYHFEYSEYDKMTHVLLKLCDHKDIKKLFKEVHNSQIQDEIEEMTKDKNDSFFGYAFFQSFISVYQERKAKKNKYRRHNAIKMNLPLSLKSTIVISKYNLLFNFTGFMFLSASEKTFKRKINLHVSLILVACLSYFLTLFNFNMVFNFTRESQYFSITIFFLVGILSIYIFNLVMKFWGLKIGFIFGFSGSFITNSLLYILKMLSMNTYEDMNISYFNSFKNVMREHQTSMAVLLIFQYFFTSAIYFTLFLYFVQFSRTLYRCFFFGIIRFLGDLIIAICIAFSTFTNISLNYGIILSIMGVMITGYLSNQGNNNYVNEYHEVPKKLNIY